MQHGLDVACFERVEEERTFEHTAIGQIRRFTMVDLPHTDAQVRVTRRAVVALPTKGDKPHGIGIVFEKPTELLLLPQAGASRPGKRIHASKVGHEA